MKTKQQLLDELRASRANYISDGVSGDIMTLSDFVEEVKAIRDELIGNGDWYEVDEDGNEL